MMMKIAMTALISVVCVLLLACGLSLAADTVPVAPAAPPPSIVDWAAIVRPVIDMLIAGVLGWIGLQVKRRWGIELDAKHNASIQTAAENAAGLLVQNGTAAAATAGSAALKQAADYVQARYPDALRHFGMAAVQVEPVILAKLGKLQGGG
jgi:hypothetical protein